MAVFSFLYLKKIKISKIYVGFGKFQKYTPVALWGRQGSNVIFFLQICNEVPGEKKGGACRPPNGRQAPVAHPRGDRPVGPPGGPVAPPAGDRGVLSPPPRATGSASLYKAPLIPSPHSLLSFDLKKSKKIQKKERGEKKGSGEALPNSALVIYR